MRRLMTLMSIVVGFGSAASAVAAVAEPLDLRQTYSGYTTEDIAHILTYNAYGNGPGTTNSFAIAAGAFSFDDPFLKSSFNPPLRTFFMGVSPDVPGTTDIDESEHLVLALGSSFAAGIVSGGDNFDTIFSGFDENTLISELELLDTSDLDPADPGYDEQKAAKNAAISNIFAFGGDVDARLGTTPAAGGPLSLVSFSSGTLVGLGAASLTPVAGAVPEPATWATMIGGFGFVGGALRRRGERRIGLARRPAGA